MNQKIPSRKPEDILADLINLIGKYENLDSSLQRLVELCREAFQAEACTLAETDLEHKFLKQIVCAGLDQKFRQFMSERKVRLGTSETGERLHYELISDGRIIEKYNLENDGGGIANPDIARQYGLKSALCQPLKRHSQIIKFLNIFTSQDTPFTDQNKYLLHLFAQQAEIILEKFESAQNLKVLEKINNAALEMAKANSEEKIYQILLKTSFEITNAEYGLIRQLDYSAGELKVVAKRGMDRNPPTLKFGKGIVWKALTAGDSHLADDVESEEWKNIYFENMRGTHSELAIPLMVEEVSVREGTKVKKKTDRLEY